MTTRNSNDAINDFKPIERATRKANKGLMALAANLEHENNLLRKASSLAAAFRPDELWLRLDSRGNVIAWTRNIDGLDARHVLRSGTWKKFKEMF